MSFWDRRLAEFRGSGSRPAPYVPAGSPVSYAPAQPAAGPDEVPGYVRQQLAIRRGSRREEDLARHISREGYISKPPLWVQRQPRDTCPNCGGPDLAAISSGGYSRPGAPGTILRCFDCGWSSGRGVSAMWGLPPSGPVAGPAVQSRDGTVSLKNTGLINIGPSQ